MKDGAKIIRHNNYFSEFCKSFDYNGPTENIFIEIDVPIHDNLTKVCWLKSRGSTVRPEKILT